MKLFMLLPHSGIGAIYICQRVFRLIVTKRSAFGINYYEWRRQIWYFDAT